MYQQLSEISSALSEILVDGKCHYPSKVSQETAVVFYPFKETNLTAWEANCEILRVRTDSKNSLLLIRTPASHSKALILYTRLSSVE